MRRPDSEPATWRDDQARAILNVALATAALLEAVHQLEVANNAHAPYSIWRRAVKDYQRELARLHIANDALLKHTNI